MAKGRQLFRMGGCPDLIEASMSFERVTIGPCTLYRANCLEVLPTLARVDAVVSDPPYGIGLPNHDGLGHFRSSWGTLAGDDDQAAGLAALSWADERKLPVVYFASPWKPWPGEWRNLIAWDKGGAVGGGGCTRTCLKRSWELIQVARNGTMNGGRDESVWRFSMLPSDCQEHVAAKPTELLQALIERFTQPRDVIADPFMGSGSTLVAAVQTGRAGIGIEIEPRYFDIACKRIETAWGVGSLYDDTPKPAPELFTEAMP